MHTRREELSLLVLRVPLHTRQQLLGLEEGRRLVELPGPHKLLLKHQRLMGEAARVLTDRAGQLNRFLPCFLMFIVEFAGLQGVELLSLSTVFILGEARVKSRIVRGRWWRHEG